MTVFKRQLVVKEHKEEAMAAFLSSLRPDQVTCAHSNSIAVVLLCLKRQG